MGWETLVDRKAYVKATNADGVCILEGVTKTCPNCKTMEPLLEKMMRKYPEARFYQYDADDAEDIAQELGASQVPTFTIFKNGDLEDGVTGARAAELERKIKEAYDGRIVDEE